LADNFNISELSGPF